MSKHASKETHLKSKHELELLQENREMLEEVKAELLEHNHVLKLHTTPAENAAPQVVEKPAAPSYIKQPEDMQRIASNTSKINDMDTVPSNTTALLQSNVRQMFEFQFQLMNVWMQSWSDILDNFASSANMQNNAPR